MGERSEMSERISPREKADKARQLLISVAERSNELLGQSVITAEGRIDPGAYDSDHDGIYSEADIAADAATVRDRQMEWSGLNDEKVRAFRLDEYGLTTEGKNADQVTSELLTEWKSRQEQRPGALAEAVITSVFNRILHDRFLVVRTAEYDDVENGVDNLIVDTETGNVVCAVDDVASDREGDRAQNKDDRNLRKLRRGGTTIKYGLTFANGQPKKAQLEHIPVLRISLMKQELDSLLLSMASDPEAQASDSERSVFGRILSSLEDQVTAVQGERLPTPVKANLDRLQQSLQTMREMVGAGEMGKAA